MRSALIRVIRDDSLFRQLSLIRANQRLRNDDVPDFVQRLQQ